MNFLNFQPEVYCKMRPWDYFLIKLVIDYMTNNHVLDAVTNHCFHVQQIKYILLIVGALNEFPRRDAVDVQIHKRNPARCLSPVHCGDLMRSVLTCTNLKVQSASVRLSLPVKLIPPSYKSGAPVFASP